MTTRSPLLCHARLCLSLLLIGAPFAHSQVPGQSIPTLPTVAVTQSPQGFDATIGKETLHLIVCSASILHLYGLGQHQSGMFNYRGSTVELGQNNTDVAIPFLVSTKGYAVVWNTAAYTYVDNRFPLELSFDSIAGDGVDYFVLYGPEMDDIIHQYRNLTGHAPCCRAGPTASSNPRIATPRSKRSSPSRNATAANTSPWTSQLRNRKPRHHSHHLVAIRQHPHHRTTHRNLRRHAR